MCSECVQRFVILPVPGPSEAALLAPGCAGRTGWIGPDARASVLDASALVLDDFHRGPAGRRRRLRSCESRSYKSRARPALTAKLWARGEIHERRCHGLIASSASQRRTVEADTDVTTPRTTASAANSALLQYGCRTSLSAGRAHTIALTPPLRHRPKAADVPQIVQTRKPPDDEPAPPRTHHVGGDVASGGDLRVGSGRGQHHPGPHSCYSPRARRTRAVKITHSPGLRVTDTDRPAGADGASSPPVTPLRPLTTVSPDRHSCGEARSRRGWAP